ncbi:MAG: hypothetical protein NTZ37_05660 [Methanoregula sp.]|nr:hypothetical protein [Methanoregula sp.]
MTTQIQKFSNIVLAAVLVMAITAVTVSADDTTSAGCTRSYLIQLGLSKSGANETAVQIVYGFSPLPEGADGTLKGSINGAGGIKLSEFNLHDPRLQFGDDLRVSEDGKNMTALSGIQQTADYADIIIMFPVTDEAKTFSLYDSTGTLLKSVDLSKAENRATWNCTPDYGITPPRASEVLPVTTRTPVGAGTILCAIGAAACAAVVMRRK